MSDQEIAWVAGLLEGEGSFSRKGNKGTKRNIMVQCHMTDLDVLQRLHRLVGAGSLNGPYQNGPKGSGWKPRWLFQVCGPLAAELMAKILPFMCSRRAARIKELLAEFASVKPKVYRMLHVGSGAEEATNDLAAWQTKHGVSSTGLWRTLTGQRRQCRGWKRLA